MSLIQSTGPVLLLTAMTASACDPTYRPFSTGTAANQPEETSTPDASDATWIESADRSENPPSRQNDAGMLVGAQPATSQANPANEACQNGETTPCGPDNENGICRFGSRTCEGNRWGACEGATLPGPRDCRSSLDNDCDGPPDDSSDAVCVCAPGAAEACDPHPGQDGRGPCRAGERQCLVSEAGSSSQWSECSGSIGPVAADSCSLVGDDSNCDGIPNGACACVEGETQPCGPENVSGICRRGVSTCVNSSFSTCEGAVFPEARDCTSPVDNNCDGLPDNRVDEVCRCQSGEEEVCGQHPGRDGNGQCRAGVRGCQLSANRGSSGFGACVGSVGPFPSDSCAVAGDDANCDGIENGQCGAPGDQCNTASPCSPGLTCVNGTCCDSPCDGACQVCSPAGVCGPRPANVFCGPGEQCNRIGVCESTGRGLVSAGSTHTCAITPSGGVRCWGDNRGGLLGYGHDETIGDDETPAEAAASGLGGDLDFGTTDRVFQVSAGSSFSCALFESGRIRCWGGTGPGTPGQGASRLGTRDATPNAAGFLIPRNIGDVDVGGPAVSLTTGEFQACAVLQTGGMSCWGPDNGAGVLGTGSREPVVERPGQNVLLGGRTALQSVMGSTHTCALLAGAEVTCWGLGGTGNTVAASASEQVLAPPTGQVFGTETIVGLTAGIFHTCSVASNGSMRCWGTNNAGQLGYAHRATVNLLEHVPGGVVGSLNTGGPVLQAEAARSLDVTCALLTTGNVRCWGRNEFGQLGYGHTQEMPANVSGSSVFGTLALNGRAIALATGGRCAVLEDRSIQCWGLNFNGALGAGNAALAAEDQIGLQPITVDLE